MVAAHGHAGGGNAFGPLSAFAGFDRPRGPSVPTVSTAIHLQGLRKAFGSVNAVDGVDLDVADGEFLTLLGPSGSGKTTVLRLIAGFEQPSGGTIVLDGVDVTRLPPYARQVNTVFQDYALFPHMNVRQNVEYGLRVKGVSKSERSARAQEALESVRLGDLGDRRPNQLSGGQRQRVALARALVNRPKVLLLDEPLGALDLKLREQMQGELKEIQRSVGITFVFVTHDQEEALTLSDRIAVFDQGRVQQIGAPAMIYERPATEFVAGFVGTSNFLRGEAAEHVIGEFGTFLIRPERIRVLAPGTTSGVADRTAAGVVRDVIYLGSATRLVVDLEVGTTLTVVLPAIDRSSEDVATIRGQRVAIAWATDNEYRLA